MNSLTYLSRQFDVLASARTPPSTPTSDRPAFIGDQLRKGQGQDGLHSSSIPRVNTWSTKSFLFNGPSSLPRPTKRSFSSPTLASVRKLGAVSTLSSSASPEPGLSSTTQSVETLIQRMFFIRVVLLAWHNIRAAWYSLWGYKRALDEPEPALIIEMDNSAVNITPSSRKPTIPPQPQPPSITPHTHRSSSDPLPSPTLSESESEAEAEIDDSKPQVPASAMLHQSTMLIRASESPASASRSPTPTLAARKAAFQMTPKTLVLDLDETLIHSTSRPLNWADTGKGFFGLGSFRGRNKGASHVVEVFLGGRSTLYHVYKRPFVDYFLRTVSSWYTLVIFTASMQEYADPVIDWLDAGRGILAHRLFRDSCTQLPNGSFTKDLSVVGADLSRVCLIDNSPVSYKVNEANGIPIEGWTHDPHDEALLDLLPVLDSLRFTSDVRRVLGLRTAGVTSHA